MGLDWGDDDAILKEFASYKDVEVGDYEIITDYAQDEENDVPAPDRTEGACAKAGKVDGWVEIPKDSRYGVGAGEIGWFFGEGYMCGKVDIKWIVKKA